MSQLEGSSELEEALPEQFRKVLPDPRVELAKWANNQDEWLRLIVDGVLSTGRALPQAEIEQAYALFRQEKGLDDRTLGKVDPIGAPEDEAEEVLPLSITELADVEGVNAIVPGSTIEPHAVLTILYGENGTGKTGYSRIFKALAGSRTAVEILGDINAPALTAKSAKIKYKLGEAEHEMAWTGETGLSPFTRSSIFDSPAVNYHVDEALGYVYVPSVLSLYNHVVNGIKAVNGHVEDRITSLRGGSTILLERFPRDSSLYSAIETLGAATDLAELSDKANADADAQERIDQLESEVAALGANTSGATITVREREQLVLAQAEGIAGAIASFDSVSFNESLSLRSELQRDYATFREELFRSADLPAEPEDTWQDFVAAGDRYRQHLVDSGVHDESRCLYCRQELTSSAAGLIGKYSDFLTDKISADIGTASEVIRAQARSLASIATTEIESFVGEFKTRGDQPSYLGFVSQIFERFRDLKDASAAETTVEPAEQNLDEAVANIKRAAADVSNDLDRLRQDASSRSKTLSEKKLELVELKAAVELSRSWEQIETEVKNAKEADRLRLLAKPFPALTRSTTDLAKTASDQLMNQSFGALFEEECQALDAPSLTLQFVGKQGKAQRRKLLSGDHKPSKVLSEGEQKVLAIADFLAEARLSGISAPVIFDDPVSSLDHRRINEVAERIAGLADDTQVIVFTHDILFATKLLSLFEQSKSCAYYLVSDEQGKGNVSKATGQSWDSLKTYKGKVNKAIQDASAAEGETRLAFVQLGYSAIRSWCEVFVERELLNGVSERYQPNVRIGALPKLKAAALAEAVPVITRVFDEACRHIPGHSHPLVTQGVAPTVESLKSDWADLEECQKAFRSAQS